ncbi:MAG: gamma-glutamyltransferase [Thermoanaerobaculia bacterium]
MRSNALLLTALLAVTLVTAPPLAGAAAPAQVAVVSGEADATDVGIAVLEQGGNAVDAAVATALALAVVHPEAGNLGGGGFAVVRIDGEFAALDFREVAPAAASATMFVDAAGVPVKEASVLGPLAAGVPGSPAGLFELHRRFGRLAWRQVVAPAVRLARDGFLISERTAKAIAEERDGLARFPETAAVWLPGGRPLGAGERLRLPDLARTLDGYAERGPTAITTGAVAAAIETVSLRHQGVLRAADLAAYRPVWREPLRFRRFIWDFVTMPLPSTGGAILGEVLGMLERREWESLPAGGVQRTHLLVEAFRRAFADRFDLGDPATSPRTAEELLDAARLDRLAAGIDPARATPSEAILAAPPATAAEGDHTTHLSVIDGDGNLVALTTTVNDLFGCKLWVPGAGFFLNDEMDDFTTVPGRPNGFGLIQGEANRVAPGRRMLSSMSPTLALRREAAGEAAIVLGGRGGSRIPTAVTQVLLALLDGDGVRAAVTRPRLHHQWLADQLELESGFLPAAASADLAARGHRIVPYTRLVRVNVARRLADGTVEAAGDPRGPEVARVATRAPESATPAPVRVRMTTELGEIDFEIDLVRAPVTAANFLRYVDAGRYDGGRFHRTVRPDTEVRKDVPIEVIQGGVAAEKSDADFPPIPLERTVATGLRHLDGTLSMARDGPDTATSDFFVCVGDQPLLDFGGVRNPDGQGFAAFGRVVRGMEVVRAIQGSPAEGQSLAPPVAIRTVRRLP